MTFSLHVDAPRWRAHLAAVRDAVASAAAEDPATAMVPVVKGGGYGLGQAVVAREAARLGAACVAVGTVFEVPEVAGAFAGDVLVLAPFDPRDAAAAAAWQEVLAGPHGARVVLTCSDPAGLAGAAARAETLAGAPMDPAGGTEGASSDEGATPGGATPGGGTGGGATGGGPRVRVVLEHATSVRRFGMAADVLRDALAGAAPALRSGALRVEGVAAHEPLAQPRITSVGVYGSGGGADPGGRAREVIGVALVWAALTGADGGTGGQDGGTGGQDGGTGGQDGGVSPAGPGTGGSSEGRPAGRAAAGGGHGDSAAGPVPGGRLPSDVAALLARDVWVSHLDDAELAAVRAVVPGVRLRARVGTRLWLGARDALRAEGTVLAVHPAGSGPRRRAGYRQRPVRGAVVVVGGGTAHGVGMAAPSPAGTARQRVVAAGTGALEAAGRALSPFTWSGRRLWFLEPPHAQVSLLELPRGVAPPRVGDAVDCAIRLTTARFDTVVGL